MFKKLVLLSLFIFSGCSTRIWGTYIPPTPEQIKAEEEKNAIEDKENCKISIDEFTKVKTLEARKLNDNGIIYNLKAIDSSESEQGKIIRKHVKVEKWDTFLSFYTSTENWAFINRAYDKTGKVIGMEKTDSQVGGGRYSRVYEHGYLKLDRKYLESIRKTGMQFKIIGQRNEFTFELPSYYVEGFLRKLDETL